MIEAAQRWTDLHTRLVTLLVFAVSFVVLFLIMDTSLNTFDEGLVLVDAMRTLAGDLVHRDFYTPYGPGSYYILAGLFTLTPYWFLAGRIFGVAVMAGIVAAVFGLLARRTPMPITLLFTALTGLWMVGTKDYLYPTLPALLLVLCGSALVLRYLEGSRPGPLFLAGCLAGAAALFRYDTGFFMAFLHALTITTVLWLRRSGSTAQFGKIIRAIAIYAVGALAVFTPFAVTLIMAGGLEGWLSDVVDYGLNQYSAMRGLPFPGLRDVLLGQDKLGIYVPPVAVLLAAWVIFERTRGKPSAWSETSEAPFLATLLLFTFAAAILYYKGIFRVSTVHLVLTIVSSMVVLALVTEHWRERMGGGRLAIVFLALVTVVPALSYAILIKNSLLPGKAPVMVLLRGAGLEAVPMPPGNNCPKPAAMTLAVMEPDYLRVGDYIRRNTSPDERIFVALDRHDKTFANSVALYFATGRHPVTHWHQFDPGLQNRADIQRLMVADLQRSKVRWVVRDATYSDKTEPNQSSVSSGVFVLDIYLMQNFRPVARSGKIEIWLAKDVRAPANPGWTDCLKDI